MLLLAALAVLLLGGYGTSSAHYRHPGYWHHHYYRHLAWWHGGWDIRGDRWFYRNNIKTDAAGIRYRRPNYAQWCAYRYPDWCGYTDWYW